MSFFSDFFHYDFLQMALVGTFFLSVICGILSPLVIAKRFAFLGSAVSHSTLLGLALANLFLLPENTAGIFLITLSVTLILAIILAFLGQAKNIPTDSTIGIFLTSTMGLGMIILSKSTSTNTELANFLFGNIFLSSSSDIALTFFILLLVLFSIFIPFKYWAYISSDQKGAKNSGINVSLFHAFFVFILTLTIVTGLKMAGSLAINSWLIAPGLFGTRLGRTLKMSFLYSLIFSIVVSLLGLFIANFFDWPTGATFCLLHFLGLIPLFLNRTL